MQVRTKRFFFSIALFVSLYAAFPHSGMAATLYVSPSTADVLMGDSVSLDVRIDTDEGECINTVDAVITYGDGIQAVDVSRGSSILTLWVEEPHIDDGTQTITFAGGIPNGYCGRIPGDPSLTNVIAKLVFRAPGFSVGASQSNTATIAFDSATRVLLNDGFGTPAQLQTLDATVQLIKKVGTTTSDIWRDAITDDTQSPQPFSIELVHNPDVFSGKYYIVFNTTDKQSGLDHFEIFEESANDLYSFSWGSAETPWTKEESPYVLHDQDLRSTIRVKAVDKAGNERIATLIPDESLRRIPVIVYSIAAFVSVVGIILLGLAVWYFVRRRKKKGAALTPESDVGDTI